MPLSSEQRISLLQRIRRMTSSAAVFDRRLSVDDALKLNTIGFFQYRLLFLCGFAFMADSLEVNLMVYISSCAGAEWNLSFTETATISSIVFMGIMLGSLFWGLFADRYGRKMSLLLACGVITLFGFATGAAPNIYWLIVFRALCGFGIGGMNVPYDLMAEFLPNEEHAKFLMYIQGFWTLGNLAVTGLAWSILGVWGWRVLAYVSVIPIALTTLFTFLYFPESPRWLLIKGRTAEAEVIIREAAEMNGVTMPPFTLINDEKYEVDTPDASYWDLLKYPHLRKITIPLWIVWFGFGFTYYGVILFVARIFSNNGDADDLSESHNTCSFVYYDLFINTAAELAAVALCIFVVDKYGRINSIVVFFILGAIAVFAMGFPMAAPVLIAVAFFGRLAITSANMTTWLATPELYSTQTRTVGHGSALAWSRFGAFLSPYMIQSELSVTGIGVVLGVVNIVAAIAAKFLPETSEHYLAEQQRLNPDETPELNEVSRLIGADASDNSSSARKRLLQTDV